MAHDLRILLTTTQLDQHGARFEAAAPDATFVAMSPDGTLHVDGDPIEADAAACAVAFGSTDLFDRADEADERARHFFVHLLKSETVRWLHMAAAGVDNPVFGMLLDKGVRLTTSHHTDIPIAEYVLAQVLRARLPLDAMAEEQRRRRWTQFEWNEVAASRWLVIGMGNIGRAIAVRARAFGAEVTGVRRNPTGREPVDRMIGPAQIIDALPHHDIVVLAVPATRATAGMVDDAFLGALAPDTILVNIGRGALVDEKALRHHLDAGRPRVAVLDVTSTEPLPEDHWLWEHPDVVLTAHTSAGGRQRVGRAAEVFASNLERWVRDEALHDEVVPDGDEAHPT